ncbi:hypothetical protein OUZ56_030599 [Daphnia magna]|uniref:GMP synthase n=1 Tax=Daphnia magna TaxID=35525 RepID=A0ABQ9ZSP5_9CRUS|nr:hypothetical protein OUZ56_030599 [Daphnia magna]
MAVNCRAMPAMENRLRMWDLQSDRLLIRTEQFNCTLLLLQNEKMDFKGDIMEVRLNMHVFKVRASNFSVDRGVCLIVAVSITKGLSIVVVSWENKFKFNLQSSLFINRNAYESCVQEIEWCHENHPSKFTRINIILKNFPDIEEDIPRVSTLADRRGFDVRATFTTCRNLSRTYSGTTEKVKSRKPFDQSYLMVVSQGDGVVMEAMQL